MMKFIRLFLKNNIFKYSYLLLLFCAVSSCEQNQTVFGPSSKPRYSVFADKMNINYAFNYNHTPLGTQPIKNVFISDSLWQSPKVNMYLKTSATSAIENQLNVNSFRSFLNFFSNYLERNDLSLNNNEILSLIHSFGVANVSNTSSNTVGLATAYYYNEFEDSILLGYPSMNFVLVAKMQSMFVSQPIDLVQKYIEATTVHEIIHSRGLISLGSYDHTHNCHLNENNVFQNCVMENAYLFFTYPERYYPPRLCFVHRKIIQDSLRNIITTGLMLRNQCP